MYILEWTIIINFKYIHRSSHFTICYEKHRERHSNRAAFSDQNCWYLFFIYCNRLGITGQYKYRRRLTTQNFSKIEVKDVLLEHISFETSQELELSIFTHLQADRESPGSRKMATTSNYRMVRPKSFWVANWSYFLTLTILYSFSAIAPKDQQVACRCEKVQCAAYPSSNARTRGKVRINRKDRFRSSHRLLFKFARWKDRKRRWE